MKPGDLRRCSVLRSDTHVCLPDERRATGTGKWSFLRHDDVIFILETDILVSTTSSNGDEKTTRRYIKFLSSKGIMYRYSGYLVAETEPLLT